MVGDENESLLHGIAVLTTASQSLRGHSKQRGRALIESSIWHSWLRRDDLNWAALLLSQTRQTIPHRPALPQVSIQSCASNIFRQSGITLGYKTAFEVFARVGPDYPLERLTEGSVGLVTNRPGNVYELLVTLFE